MTIAFGDLALYAGAVLILFLTPGPVWVALIARAISGGFNSAWPLALGVVIGDAVWPLLAIFGLSWITSVYAGFMDILRWVAVLIFVAMGVGLIRNADHSIASDSRLTRPGMWAGFAAGVLVILGNPKAILFYLGVLPGFFDLREIGWPDIAAIMFVSMTIPLVCNLILALFIGRTRWLLTSQDALRRANIGAGILLILVGAIIALT